MIHSFILGLISSLLLGLALLLSVEALMAFGVQTY